MLKVVRIGRSNNPNTVVDPSDNNFNLTKDGRQMLCIDVQNPENPFEAVHTRSIFQSVNAQGVKSWRVPVTGLNALVGTCIAGEIQTKEVAPFEINGRKVSKYTCAVFGNELSDSNNVFRNFGHLVVGDPRSLPPRFNNGIPSKSSVEHEELAGVTSIAASTEINS